MLFTIYIINKNYMLFSEYYNNVFENVFFIVFLLFVCCGYFMSNPFIVYLLKKYICLKFEDELKLVFVFERQS